MAKHLQISKRRRQHVSTNTLNLHVQTKVWLGDARLRQRRLFTQTMLLRTLFAAHPLFRSTSWALE